MADVAAMNLCGGRAFGQGLLKVATNDAFFGEAIHGKLAPKLLMEKKTISNFSKSMELAYSAMGKSAIDALQAAILSRSQTHSVYYSHPALKVRVDYSKKSGGVSLLAFNRGIWVRRKLTKFRGDEEKGSGSVRELIDDGEGGK